MKALEAHFKTVWLVLVLATGLSYGLAELHPGAPLGPITALTLFALAATKGWMVIDVFMGLRHAPPLWRWLMLGWLGVVCAVVAGVYVIRA